MAISAFGDKGFEHLTFVIDGPPKVMGLAIYLHEHLVQMPLPLRPGTKTIGPLPSDLRREHWTETIPPVPHRLMTNIDAALVEKIFDVPQRKRKADIHHDRKADDLRGRFKIPKGILAHPANLATNPLTTGFL